MNGNLNNAHYPAEAVRENDSFPDNREVSDADPEVLKAFAIMAGQSETEDPLTQEVIEPRQDAYDELLNLQRLSQVGDEEVMGRLEELYQQNKVLSKLYPELKRNFYAWRFVSAGTVTNIRSAAWLTMDDPTRFEEKIIKDGRKKESDYFSRSDSAESVPISAHAVSLVCEGLKLHFEERVDVSVNVLLEIASTDRTALRPEDKRKKVQGGINFSPQIPSELMPIVRRSLALVNSSVESNPRLLDIILHEIGSHRGLYVGSKRRRESEGVFQNPALYLLYLHQQSGIINAPEFRSTVCRLRDILVSPKAETDEKEAIKEQLKGKYGFRFLHDDSFWDLQREEIEDSSGGAEVLDFDHVSLEFKSKVVRDLRSRKRFNTAESIVSASTSSDNLGDPEQRKERILRNVMQEKEKSEEERRRCKVTESQFIRQVEHSVEGRMIRATLNEPLPNVEKAQKSLVDFLLRFQHLPEISPASRVFLNRLVQSTEGNLNLEKDMYVLDMERVMQDPFLLASLKFFSNTANHKDFEKIIKEGDENQLRKVEFLSRYMAYKVLNIVGTEKRGSPLLFRSNNGYPIENLRDYDEGYIGSLYGMSNMDSEREKAFMLMGIEDLEKKEPSQFELVGTVEEDSLEKDEKSSKDELTSPDTTRILKERFSRITGKVLEKYRDIDVLMTEFGLRKKRRIALTAGLLGLSVLLIRPQFLDLSKTMSRIDSGPLGGAKTLLESKEQASLFVGDVINDANFQEGDDLGFLPRRLALEGLELSESIVTPEFATAEDIETRYADYEGLVLKRTIQSGGEVLAPGDRELQGVIITDDENSHYTFEERPFDGVRNVNPKALEVHEVFSANSSQRVRKIENMSVPEYGLNEDFAEAKELYGRLNPESRLAKYYALLIFNLEEAKNNNLTNEEISSLIERELGRFVDYYVNDQFYQLDVPLSAPTFAEELSWNQDLGQECEVSAELIRELLEPFGIKVGKAYGEGLTYSNSEAWTDPIGHVNNLIGLPNGEVLQLESTPSIVRGRTPEADIDSLKYQRPNTADLLISRVTDIFEDTSPSQGEVVIATTTMLALLGKYRNRSRRRELGGFVDEEDQDQEMILGGEKGKISNGESVQEHINGGESAPAVDSQIDLRPLRVRGEDVFIDFSQPFPFNSVALSVENIVDRTYSIRTQTIDSILQLMKPLADEFPEEKLEETTQVLLYSALSLNNRELQRFLELVNSASDLRRREVPSEELITEELIELGNMIQEFRVRLMRDDIVDKLNNNGGRSRKDILEEFLVESGWQVNGKITM